MGAQGETPNLCQVERSSSPARDTWKSLKDKRRQVNKACKGFVLYSAAEGAQKDFFTGSAMITF